MSTNHYWKWEVSYVHLSLEDILAWQQAIRCKNDIIKISIGGTGNVINFDHLSHNNSLPRTHLAENKLMLLKCTSIVKLLKIFWLLTTCASSILNHHYYHLILFLNYNPHILKFYFERIFVILKIHNLVIFMPQLNSFFIMFINLIFSFFRCLSFWKFFEL